MAFVPGGTFFAGIPTNTLGLEPGHDVTLKPFFADLSETTVESYLVCVEAGACTVASTSKRKGCNLATPQPSLKHPVNCATWEMAKQYCAWRGGRLPTAEEWELSARGLDKRAYPWGNDAPNEKRACWNQKRTCPVAMATEGTSPYGLSDMAGNVAEWTSTTADILPGPGYIIKGGSFVHDPLDTEVENLRSYVGYPSAGQDANPEIGFRCVKDIP